MKKSMLKVPATYSQKALHFIQTFDPQIVSYNIPFEFKFSSDIDTAALQIALDTLVRRHDILRTSFEWDGEALYQMVSSEPQLDHEVIDATAWTAEAIHEKCKGFASTPFDLAKAPLFKSRLLQRQDGWSWCLCFHHIAFDHISITQFAEEVNAAYERALINPDGISHQPMPLSLVDYGVWQQEHQSPSQLQHKVAYWEEQVPDPSVMLDLPTDYPRQPVMTGKGNLEWFHFNESTANLIRETAQSFKVSRYVLTMTQCAILLHRYSNAEQFLLGTPFANRSDQEELQRIFGCFMNTLPLPFDFSDSPDFKTLLDRTQKHFQAIFQRQDVPFEHIVERLKPPRESNHNPLFQVAFMYQAPPMSMTLGEAIGINQRLHNGSSKFDLTFWLWDAEDGRVGGTVEYASSLFAQSSIQSMLDVFERIVHASCDAPDTPIHRLPLVNTKDPKSMALCGEVFEYQSLGVHELVATTAKGHLNSLAVISDDGQLTYAELWSRSCKLAKALRQKGVQSGDLVGIALPRSTQLLVGCLGILQAGCTYVPLDPEYPEDRLSYMISHSGMKHIVCEPSASKRLGGKNSNPPELLEFDELLASIQMNLSSQELAPTAVNPELAAYIIYTSGSTGLPKGVAVPHRSVVNFLLTMKKRPGFTQDDRLMAVTTLSFDIAVLELFLPISVGGTVDIVPSDVSKDPHQLCRRLAAFKPTIMQATPATWRMLIHAGWLGQEKPRILVGGEALPEDLVGDLLERGRAVWNMYGPTETTIWSTCAQIIDAGAPVTIGAPIGNTQCFIMDQYHNPLPVGVPGELYIGGDGVTLGYLHQPDLTEERFIAHEGSKTPLYRTGDLVTRLISGELKYHNRLDNQVKIRGFRIELGEIEQVLLQQEVVQSGAVVVQGVGFDKRLVAFYVVQEGKTLTSMKLRRALSSHLPKHMLPELLVVINALPLTPSGKVDRKKLSVMEVQSTGGPATAQPPSTPSELYYAKLFCQILKRDQVSVGDNFFDVGGHSFASLSLVAAAKKDHNVVVPANALVLNNLGQLAAQYPINAAKAEPANTVKQDGPAAEKSQSQTAESVLAPEQSIERPWWKRLFVKQG